jgi:hypothetical protein
MVAQRNDEPVTRGWRRCNGCAAVSAVHLGAAILHRALPDRPEERKSLDLAEQDGPAGAT